MGRHITIGVDGITLWGHCGVTAEERAVGQRLVVDVRLTPRSVPGSESDELSGTVDYGAVAEVVRACVEEGTYNLLERVATVIAERLFAEYRPREVAVTVRKPAPPVTVPAEEAWVEVVVRP